MKFLSIKKKIQREKTLYEVLDFKDPNRTQFM